MEENNIPQQETPATPAQADAAPLSADEMRDQIVKAISTVYDPEISVNIYELGLIYDVQIEGEGKVTVVMTLTSPSCPAAGMLPGEVEQKTRTVPGVLDVDVQLTFDPPWEQGMMSEEARLELGFM